MSESDINEDELGSPLLGLLKPAIIWLSVLLFLYIIHIGPMLFLFKLADYHPDDGPDSPLWSFERPHLHTAYNSEYYFYYLSWCAGQSMDHSDWMRFKSEYEKGF